MPRVLDAVDLRLASLRASWLEEPTTVAARLLDAAVHPGLLDGVTPLAARVAAGKLLCEHGQPEQGIAILRQAVQDSAPASDDGARIGLAFILAESAEPAEALALAAESIRAKPTSSERPLREFAMAEHLAYGGHWQRAEEWAADAFAAAQTQATPVRSVSSAATMMVARAKKKLLTDIVRAVQESGTEAARQVFRAGAIGLPDDPPWPVVSDGRMLWWPLDEYGWLVSQLPETTSFLGATWRDHVARAESAMRIASHSQDGPIQLVPASIAFYTDYIRWRGTDPRSAATMTGFAAYLTHGLPHPRWPPKDRKPCWCGSGHRYRDCCRARAAA